MYAVQKRDRRDLERPGEVPNDAQTDRASALFEFPHIFVCHADGISDDGC